MMTNKKIITDAELMNEAELNQLAGGWRPPGFVPPALTDSGFVDKNGNLNRETIIRPLKDWRDY